MATDKRRVKPKTGFLKSNIPDFLMITGSIAIAYGSGLIYFPAGFIVGGFLALGIGYVLARAS